MSKAIIKRWAAHERELAYYATRVVYMLEWTSDRGVRDMVYRLHTIHGMEFMNDIGRIMEDGRLHLITLEHESVRVKNLEETMARLTQALTDLHECHQNYLKKYKKE